MITLSPQQIVTFDSGFLFDFLLKEVATTENFPDPGMVLNPDITVTKVYFPKIALSLCTKQE